VQEELPKKLHLEGYGNSKPEEDTPFSAMGRMFRRISRRSDMKSMKIATEDTKDEMTFGETVAHCVNVALVPEVYAEDIEGEGNLGFYRPIGRIRNTPNLPFGDPPSSQQRVLESVNKWQKENVTLKKIVVTLRKEVAKLEENLKTRDLEAAVWKLRAQELEEELRQYRDEDDDNSTIEPRKDDQDHDDESENGIDHEWTEKQKKDSNATVDEEVLVDTTFVPKKTHATVKEDVLVDTTFVPKKIAFDPLKEGEEDASKEPLNVEQDPDVEEEAEPNADKEAEPDVEEEAESDAEEEVESDAEEEAEYEREEQQCATEVKEEVLVDTNIAPEPVAFDPMKRSSQDKEKDATEDALFDLLASLSANVEPSIDETKHKEAQAKL